MWFSGSYDLILFIKKVNYIYLVCVWGGEGKKKRGREREVRGKLIQFSFFLYVDSRHLT